MITGIAIWGALVIGAVYMLRAIRNILHGPLNEEFARLRDVDFSQVSLAILVICLLGIGIFPRMLTDKVKPRVAEIVKMTHEHARQRLPITRRRHLERSRSTRNR